VHDIGKNIVRFMLEANGYDVVDLGIDVPAQAFISSLQETGASYLGLSALLTVSYESMKETVEALESAGIRKKTKVMIGGAPVDDLVLEFSGADARGASAVAAVDLVNTWIKGGN
ncbi:MAG: cobalamin B12-binding domain-containing protein, partial [Chloroflexi bacterium]|nr:cobalamin B12-binding domain-containing protein [Chloroflexota bacterium]